MKLTVCIGSSCHLKGSKQIVEQLQSLIAEKKLGDKVELAGAFCMGKCQTGVSVTVDKTYHSVQPENVAAFFDEKILKAIS
jgi:NADH:ubiquinone oxidoreductase subunit E